MANLQTYTVLNEENNVEEVFQSQTEFARHLGITVGRLNKKLAGKRTLTHLEYADLKAWLFEPIDYSQRGQNRKKGVKNL
jgi:hypothetical protein